MNWIQALLILSIVALLVYLLRSRTSARTKAWVKVGGVLFVIAAVYAILRPDDTTVVANWLGVDRGADLIGYALIIAFVFTTLSTYMRFKDLELQYARLAAGAQIARSAGRHSHRARRRGLSAFCSSRKKATVLATPSSSLTLGAQPSTSSARLMSRQDRRRSPSRGGWNSGSSGSAGRGCDRRM